MNKKFFRIALLCALLGTGAAVTSCTDYDQEIADLQDQVTALDKKVSDLQSAINAGSVITGVSTNAAGVTVTLSNGQTFNLTNGKDGANGTNGTNGTDGKDGVNGEPGAPGANGKDGLTYVPNPETGTFFLNGEDTKISYLKAGSVTATLDEHGCLVIEGVEGAKEPIVIALSSDLKSMAFVPQFYNNPSFATLYKGTAGKKNFELLASSTDTVALRVNPSNINPAAYDFQFINRAVKVAGDATDFLAIEEVLGVEDGAIFFVVSATHPEVEGSHHKQLVALQATNKSNGEVITSDYVEMLDQIVNIPLGYETMQIEGASYFPYDESWDVAENVETFKHVSNVKYDYEKYFGATYTVSLKGEGLNEGDLFVCEDGVVSVNTEKWPGTSAIGKSAKVKVTSFVGDEKVKEATFTLAVTEQRVETVFTLPTLSVNYIDLLKGDTTVTVRYADLAQELSISLKEFKNIFSGLTAPTASYVEDGEDVIENLPAGFEYLSCSDESMSVKLGKRAHENCEGTITFTRKAANSLNNLVVVLPYEVSFDETFFPAFDTKLVKEGVVTENSVPAITSQIDLSKVFDVKDNNAYVTWYVPTVDANGNNLAPDVNENFEYMYGHYTPVAKKAFNQNAVVAQSSLNYIGTFTAEKETIVLDAVLELPNHSKFYHPAALKATFLNPYKFSTRQNAVLSVKENGDSTINLANTFAITRVDNPKDTIYRYGKYPVSSTDEAAKEAAETAKTEAQEKIAGILAQYPDYLTWVADTAEFGPQVRELQAQIESLEEEIQAKKDSVDALQATLFTGNRLTDSQRAHNEEVKAKIAAIRERRRHLEQEIVVPQVGVALPVTVGQKLKAATDTLSKRAEQMGQIIYEDDSVMKAYDYWTSELAAAEKAITEATTITDRNGSWKPGYEGDVLFYILKSDIDKFNANYGEITANVIGTGPDPETGEVYNVYKAGNFKVKADATKVRSEVVLTVWVDAEVTNGTVGALMEEQSFTITVKPTE